MSTAATTPNPMCNLLVIQLISFFDTIQQFLKVPTTVDLSYSSFKVSFATDSIAWMNAFHDTMYTLCTTDEDTECHVFELMPAPANTALHRYIKDLACVHMDLAVLQAVKQEDA